MLLVVRVEPVVGRDVDERGAVELVLLQPRDDPPEPPVLVGRRLAVLVAVDAEAVPGAVGVAEVEEREEARRVVLLERTEAGRSRLRRRSAAPR